MTEQTQIKIMINRSKSQQINRSMYKINVRAYFLKLRRSNYYMCPQVEQNHRNNFNTLINS